MENRMLALAEYIKGRYVNVTHIKEIRYEPCDPMNPDSQKVVKFFVTGENTSPRVVSQELTEQFLQVVNNYNTTLTRIRK